MNFNDINHKKTFYKNTEFPSPGSPAESEDFIQLQLGFQDQ